MTDNMIDKQLISKKCKLLIQLNIKNQTTQSKNGQKGEQDVTREIDQSDVATSQGMPLATRN